MCSQELGLIMQMIRSRDILGRGGQAQANLYVRMIFGSLQNLDWKDKRLDKAPEPQRETGYQRDRISEVTGAEER